LVAIVSGIRLLIIIDCRAAGSYVQWCTDLPSELR
jgi:hypothetical protein